MVLPGLIPWTALAVAWQWLLGVLPSLTILFVGMRFLLEIPQREKQAKYQAWRVVHTAYGQKVSGARIAALEDLREQGESLSRLTLEEGAMLNKINLAGSDLFHASLSGAGLWCDNLHKAKLESAYLSNANLHKAILLSTDLYKADLRGADLCLANLTGAIYSKKTQFSKDFDPSQHGMVLQDDRDFQPA